MSGQGAEGRPRIACLATQAGHSGGAAIAMERLAAALRAAGSRVDVVTREDVGALPPAGRRFETRVRRGIRRARSALSNTLFTADWPAWDLACHPAVANADLVNVHWVAGFVAAAGVRRIVESGRPVVWTLHDMRPFTGGCHYTSGCDGFTTGCTGCPQLLPALERLPSRVLARGRRRLRGVPLTFVAPSHWMAGEAARSSLFDPAAHEVRVIPNGIDLVRYAPGDRIAARQRLGLPAEGVGILLGSVSLAERRKGAALAAEALTRAAAGMSGSSPDPAAFVVTYGGGSLSIPGLACRHLGPLDEEGVLAALHACDLHLTMAREDNLPNTVMEALACGLAVVATRTGGHPEMITDGLEGWLVGVDDVVAAAAVIKRLVAAPAIVRAAATAARRRAEAEWDCRLQASRYLELVGTRRGWPAARASRGPLAADGITPVRRRAPWWSPPRPPAAAPPIRAAAARLRAFMNRRPPPLLDGAEFAGAVFPEHAFPPRAERAEEYLAACRRGYAAMAATRVVVTGLARNVGHILPLAISRVENLAHCFADFRVVVYENDSTDDTRLLLSRWAGDDQRVAAVSEVLDDPVNPTTRCLDRAARMAAYRRRCQEVVLDRWGRFDAVIIIDFDVQGGFSIDGIASTFGHRGWDFVGSNGLICRRRGLQMNTLRQYDTWALRFDATLTPLSTRAVGGLVYQRGDPLVPVTSCFGGLGIYAMEAYRSGCYTGEDTEHATFHRAMIAAGHDRLFLNPSQLVVYGRRHRVGDGLTRLLLAAWSRLLAGRRETISAPVAGLSPAADRASRRAA
ncbi:MAG: glycosyltransferase [Planctomycetes bacterium]|nr:glycosyltransferase [Planctomycetota bacterium]